MIQTLEARPYCLQTDLSQKAKSALHKEQARRQLAGNKVRIKDIAAEIIEAWSAKAA